MFSKEQILASLDANGCKKVGKNKWTDGEHDSHIISKQGGHELIADRVRLPTNTNEAIRAALRPMFVEARAARRI